MIADRIHQARLMAGLTLAELGQRMGVTHTTIQKYEKGKLAPSSMQLFRLAQACGLRVDYFLRSANVRFAEEDIECRRTFGAKSREAVRLRVQSIVEKWVELLNCYPERPLQAFRLPHGWPAVVATLDAVEELAEELRGEWDLGLATIANLAQLLETQGILVAELDLPRDDFLGWRAKAVTEDGSTFPVVAVASQWSRDRKRFILARELGRFLLRGRLKGLKEEAACVRFAGAFLMPRAVVHRTLGEERRRVDARELEKLQESYGVPKGVWAVRAEECGVMADMVGSDLSKRFPLGDWKEKGREFEAEEGSRVFEQLVSRALNEQYISESKAAELMSMSLGTFHRNAEKDMSHASDK